MWKKIKSHLLDGIKMGLERHQSPFKKERKEGRKGSGDAGKGQEQRCRARSEVPAAPERSVLYRSLVYQ